jgi:hypothetical protein
MTASPRHWRFRGAPLLAGGLLAVAAPAARLKAVKSAGGARRRQGAWRDTMVLDDPQATDVAPQKAWS